MNLKLLHDRKLLLVDDDRIVTATLKDGLERYGLVTQAANSAADARALLERESFDLVIIDTKMPEESGVALASWLNKQRPGLPYIFLSAYGDDEMVEDAVSLGAMTYLVKPVQIPQLIPVIYSALKRGREMRCLGSQTEELKHALETNRDINVAVGLLMNRFGLTRQEAFENLRRHCRDEQMRVHDLATKLIESEETITKVGQNLLR